MNEIARPPFEQAGIRATASGAGPFSDEAAKIMGEATLVTQFSVEAAFARYAGLAPITESVGKHRRAYASTGRW